MTRFSPVLGGKVPPKIRWQPQLQLPGSPLWRKRKRSSLEQADSTWRRNGSGPKLRDMPRTGPFSIPVWRRRLIGSQWRLAGKRTTMWNLGR